MNSLLCGTGSGNGAHIVSCQSEPVIYLDWSDLERPDGSRFELDVEPLLLLVERTGFEAFGAPGAPDLYHICHLVRIDRRVVRAWSFRLRRANQEGA